jgi:prophage regulatory protein
MSSAIKTIAIEKLIAIGDRQRRADEPRRGETGRERGELRRVAGSVQAPEPCRTNPHGGKERIIRMKTAQERTSLSQATIYRKIADGTFPRQVKISIHGAGCYEADIDRWIANPSATTTTMARQRITQDNAPAASTNPLATRDATRRDNWRVGRALRDRVAQDGADQAGCHSQRW